MMRNGVWQWWLLLAGVVMAGCSVGPDVGEEPVAADTPAATDTPVVLVIGDSISMKGGYLPGVVERLGGRFRVVHNPGNGSDSAHVLARLEEWVATASPDVIHFNCGLHDIKCDRTKQTRQQPPPNYERNLREIARRLKALPKTQLMFALTTPVNEQWHHTNKPFDRRMKDVERYNAIARRVMAENGIPVNDLFQVITDAGPDTCLVRDGVHMNARGNALLAEAVTSAIERLAARPAGG